jgi:NTP pyrophosphatase (non-canonical NTP hydrolase)
MNILQVIEQYARFRKYETPDGNEALIFLVSEIGELARAHLARDPQIDQEARSLLMTVGDLGERADALVSGRKAWVRNGDRNKPHDARAEVGDVLMMLGRYCAAEGLGEPGSLMLEKMRAKGFEWIPADAEAQLADLQRKLAEAGICPQCFLPMIVGMCAFCDYRQAGRWPRLMQDLSE